MTISIDKLSLSVLFVTQAKGIQDYVLRTDKLRDMLGATELVEELPCGLLDQTLVGLGFRAGEDYQVLSRAAGAARIGFGSSAHAQALAEVWPVICAHAIPGLEVYQTIEPLGSDGFLKAIQRAEHSLALARVRRTPQLPVPGPPVKRAQRTGEAAIGMGHLPGGEREEVDAATRAKRAKRDFRDASSNKLPGVYQRMGLTPEDSARIPEDFDDISGSDREYLALIHADGNGLGELFIALEKHFSKNPALGGESITSFYQEFSHAISSVSCSAAALAFQEASDRSKESPRWPIMPLVLAGDDLTFVVRADLAIPFVRTFLTKFEELSREAISRLKKDFPNLALDAHLPSHLTSGAGIVFIKPGFPFSVGYELCESLASAAKKAAKKAGKNHGSDPAGPPEPPASTLAFHKVTASSVRTQYSDLLEHELCGAHAEDPESGNSDRNNRICLTLAPYQIGSGPHPSIDQLQSLVETLRDFPRGPVRELFTLLQTDWPRAQKHFARMLDMGKPESVSQLKAALHDLLAESSPAAKRNGKLITPFGDALTLLSF